MHDEVKPLRSNLNFISLPPKKDFLINLGSFSRKSIESRYEEFDF